MAIIRHLLGYFPGTVVGAISSLGIVLIFTRLLEPAEYGRFSLVVATVYLVDVCCLQWLRSSTLRYFESAVKEGRSGIILSTAYAVLGLIVVVIATTTCLASTFVPMDTALRTPMLIGGGLFLVWGIVRQNLTIHRAASKAGRFSLVQCAREILGLASAFILVAFFGMGDQGLVLGLAIGGTIVAVVDGASIYRNFSVFQIRKSEFLQLFGYGAPLTLVFALSYVVSTSDRYLLQYFLGSEAVGIYSASYGLARNSIATIFVFVNTAAFPLVVNRFEHGGMAAARVQMGQNCIVMLALGVPAILGLILIARPMASVLLGPEFREIGAQIIPWIGASAFLASLKTCYFDQSFQIGQRTGLIAWTVLPAAVVNIALNIFLIPLYGVMGAVYATVLAYCLALAFSVILGRRVFAPPLPVREAMRVFMAVVPMVLILLLLNFPTSPFGLAMMVGVGATICGFSYIALNVADTRTHLWQRLRPFSQKSLAADASNE